MNLWLSGFCFGFLAGWFALHLLNMYVDHYKHKHHQPPYDKRSE